jgi:hypothetical protein
MHCSFESSNSFLWDLQPKLLDEKQTTIYKRAVDRNCNLKMKASRFIFSEINQKFSFMPFTATCVVHSRHFLRHCILPSTLQPLIVHVEFFYNRTLGGEEGSTGFGGVCSS